MKKLGLFLLLASLAFAQQKTLKVDTLEVNTIKMRGTGPYSFEAVPGNLGTGQAASTIKCGISSAANRFVCTKDTTSLNTFYPVFLIGADTVGTNDLANLAVTGAKMANGTVTSTQLAAANKTDNYSFTLGVDNAAADLGATDISPQGRILMVPVACTISEITVAANAGTPKVMVSKNHAGTPTALLTGDANGLITGTAGAVACAATGAACADGTAKSGTVTIVTAGSANVLAAGDWLETTAGAVSTGAKRMSVAVTCVRN